MLVTDNIADAMRAFHDVRADIRPLLSASARLRADVDQLQSCLFAVAQDRGAERISYRDGAVWVGCAGPFCSGCAINDNVLILLGEGGECPECLEGSEVVDDVFEAD